MTFGTLLLVLVTAGRHHAIGAEMTPPVFSLLRGSSPPLLQHIPPWAADTLSAMCVAAAAAAATHALRWGTRRREAACCVTGLPSPYRGAGPICELLPVLWHALLLGGALSALAAGLRGACAWCASQPLVVRLWAAAARRSAEHHPEGLAAFLALLTLGYVRRARARAAHARSLRPSGGGADGRARCPASGSLAVVIGAGPSGLVAAKHLRDRGWEVVVFEAEQDIGGTFRYRAYEHAVQVRRGGAGRGGAGRSRARSRCRGGCSVPSGLDQPPSPALSSLT
jgi:hypothetical protein